MRSLRSFIGRHPFLLGVLICAAWIVAVVVMIAVNPVSGGGNPG